MEDLFENEINNENQKNFQIFKKNINFQNCTDSSLKLSEIENKENEQTKKYDSVNSYNFETISNNNQANNKDLKAKKKLTKEDLNNTPLPVFSCIYCSNEKVAFNHFINERIYDKYFLQTSIYDMKLLDKIIKMNPIIDYYNKNPPLIETIIRNSEFIRNYNDKNKIYNFFTSEKFKKISETNIFIVTKNFLQKLETKFIKKRNKESSNNKYNSNKFAILDENKISFQKLINSNSTFTNDYLTTNKNSMTNTNTLVIGSSSPNIGLSPTFNNTENVTNNMNICFNPNNMMGSIMENIEKNEESDDETEEKFLDILEEKKKSPRRINKNNISFEEKYYDIWNPDITLVKEEEENKNINYFSDRNIKNAKRIINYIHKRNKQNKNNYKEDNIMNQNNENKSKTKFIFKRNIFSSYMNSNLKKRNLNDFINYKNMRNLNIDPLLSKQKFFTRDTNKYRRINYNLDLIKNIIMTKSKENFSNTVSQSKRRKNLLYLIKSAPSSSNDKKRNNNNSYKLIRKTTLSPKNNIFKASKKKNSTLSNFFYANLKGLKYNSINIPSDLSHRKNYNINLDININNKKFDIFSKYLKITNQSLLSSSLREKNSFASVPNLKNNIIQNDNLNHNYKNNFNLNINKKIRIPNNLRKINSYNFLKNRCVSLSKPPKKRILLV